MNTPNMISKPQSIVKTFALMVLLLGTMAHARKAQDTGQEDTSSILVRARALATSGHRPEALSLMKERLEQVPGDNEVRVYYGIVNSWEGHYDEAREALTQVLETNPNHGDALPALINVELWSDHPARAEQLAKEAVDRMPDNTAFLLLYARTLRALQRNHEAMLTLDQVLAKEPGNEDALQLRRRMEDITPLWYAEVAHYYDWFSNGQGGQHETQYQLRRGDTKIGSIIGRFSRAEKFGLHSNQFEVDAYPSLRSGTYAYLNFGGSPDHTLYPQYRLGFDLYQSLPHGLEISGGYRRLSFTSSDVNIYTAWFGKYYGNWLIGARTYITPDSSGVSRSVTFQARRYFGGGGLFDYFDIRGGTGASLDQVRTTNEIALLNSNSFRVEVNKSVAKRWAFDFLFSLSRQDRTQLSTINQYEVSGSLYYLF